MSEEYARARWEGEIEARMADAERRLDAVNGSIKAHAESNNNLALKVGGLSTKVAVYSGIGGVVGAGVVSAAVAFLFH